MKQKIVIKVAMPCEDCRSKAMEIAAAFEGVISVAIEGKDLDLLVVTGNEVDSACLIKRLRKKVGYADLVTIAEVKPKSPEKPKSPKKTKPTECPVPTCCSGCTPPCHPPPCRPPPCPPCRPPPCCPPPCRPPPCPPCRPPPCCPPPCRPPPCPPCRPPPCRPPPCHPPPCPVSCNKSPPTCQRTCGRQPSGPNCPIL